MKKNDIKKNILLTITMFTLAFFFGLISEVKATQNTCEYTDKIAGKRYSTKNCNVYYITSCQPISCQNPMCIYTSIGESQKSGVVSRYELSNSQKAGCDNNTPSETPSENPPSTPSETPSSSKTCAYKSSNAQITFTINGTDVSYKADKVTAKYVRVSKNIENFTKEDGSLYCPTTIYYGEPSDSTSDQRIVEFTFDANAGYTNKATYDEGNTTDPIVDEEKQSVTFYDASGTAITLAMGKETNNIYVLDEGAYTDVTKLSQFASSGNVTVNDFNQFTYLYHAGSVKGGSYIFGKSCDIKTNQYAKTANYATVKSNAIVCANAEDISKIEGAGSDKCDYLLGDPNDPKKQDLAYWIQWCLDIIKYAAIIALLIFSTIDFVQALIKDDKDAIKKAATKALKRFVFAVLIFFLPIIVEVLMKVFGAYGTCGIG